jgi:large subunit ribosomal protein L23
MALSFFKKKKTEEKKEVEKKTTRQGPEKTKTEIPKPKKERKGEMNSYRILKSLHVTEKATDLSKNNKYVFEVFSRSNKTEIKKAIGETFDVDVIKVNIIKTPAKKRRQGRTLGWKKGYKKAIVSIKKGQKIDILPK